jgi:hypothetical protein
MSSIPRFAPDTRVKWHSEQIAAEVDGQVVVMGLSQGKYVGFDVIATNIWHRLEQPRSVSELCDGLVKDFDGDTAVIRQDVVELLIRLHELGLIEVETGGASA